MRRESRITRIGRSSALTDRHGRPTAILFAALLATAISAPIASAWTTMNIPGTWDGYNAADTTAPFRMNKVSAPGTPGGADWFTNVMFVAASGGDVTGGTYQLKLAADGSFASNWGGSTVAIDGTTTFSWISGNNGTITVQNGFYYSFRTLNPPSGNNATLSVMKTSNRPVTLLRSSQSPATPSSTQGVAVNIALSASKSAEEHIYVRWTTNNFAVSMITEAHRFRLELFRHDSRPADGLGREILCVQLHGDHRWRAECEHRRCPDPESRRQQRQ